MCSLLILKWKPWSKTDSSIRRTEIFELVVSALERFHCISLPYKHKQQVGFFSQIFRLKLYSNPFNGYPTSSICIPVGYPTFENFKLLGCPNFENLKSPLIFYFRKIFPWKSDILNMDNFWKKTSINNVHHTSSCHHQPMSC